MKLFLPFRFYSLISLFIITLVYSCSKGNGGGGGSPVDPCLGITILVSATTTNPSAAGASDGSITASASGSSGFTFSNNGGSFQSSGSFTNLAAGSYTIVAKNPSGCSGSASFILTAPGACTGVNITVTTVITNNTPCQSTNSGMITLTAIGGTGPYMYSLNGGAFQGSPVFSNLNAGNYAATARDVNGCTGTNSTTVNNLVAGTLFTAVRTIINNNCTSCHNNSDMEGGMNWTIDCNIVTNKDRIKARAIDATPSAMPPTGLISPPERQKITDWINAGGLFTN